MAVGFRAIWQSAMTILTPVESDGPSAPAKIKKYEAKSLALALSIVEFVASADESGVSVSQVARTVGTTKSNAFRILQTLCDRNYLSDVGEGLSRRYRMGSMFLRLASAMAMQRPLADEARQVLRRLSRETNLTSRFAVLDRGYVVPLVREVAPDGVQLAPYQGLQELVHCSAAGKALLSAMSEEEVQYNLRDIGLPRRTARTITDPRAFAMELAQIREIGFSIDDEEDFEGVIGVGAVVRDHTNIIVGAISVSGLKLGLTTSDLKALGVVVRRYAHELSKELGARPLRSSQT